MDITLHPELAQFVKEQIADGGFVDESDVINAAVTALKSQQEDDRYIGDWTAEELRAELLPAIESLDRGEGLKFETPEELHEFFEDIKARGRQRSEKRSRQASDAVKIDQADLGGEQVSILQRS